MKKNILLCSVVCIVALSFMMCSNNNKPTSNTPEQQQQGLAGPLPGGPQRPNMDTRKTTTTEMQKSNAKKSLSGTIIDGCQERITIKKGEKVTLLLPVVAGTGYYWTLPNGSKFVTSAENGIQSKESSGDQMVGKGEKQVFELTGTTVGTETLNFIYSRSFEKNKIESKCDMSVTVQ
jgi:predicted secreted protein